MKIKHKIKKQPIVVISENNGIINLHTTGAIMVESTADYGTFDGMGRFMIYRKDLKTALKHVRDFGAIGSIQLYAKNQDGEISGPEQWADVTVDFFHGAICNADLTRLRIGCTVLEGEEAKTMYAWAMEGE